MISKNSYQNKIQKLQDEYEMYLDKLYNLKMKKLNILVDYRKKLDEVELDKLKFSYKEDVANA